MTAIDLWSQAILNSSKMRSQIDAGRSIGTTYHKPRITKFKLDQKGLNAGQFRSWFARVEDKVRTQIYYDSSTID